MKKIFFFIFIVVISFISCSDNNNNVKLEEGTEAFQLAEDLSETVAYLDPEENNTLVSSDIFSISTGEVVQTLQTTAGDRVSQLKNFNEEQLVNLVHDYAESLGQKKLLLHEAENEGFTVSESAIDSILQIQYSRVGGQEQFQERLQQSGLTLEAVSEQIRETLLIDKYLNEVLSEQIEVSDEEILESYKQDKTATVRHILFSTQGESDSARQETLEQAKEVLEKAQSGQDFAELARQYSEDPDSKSDGGLYEDFEKGKMVPPFEEAAFSIPEGEISGLVETRFGYHIIKVIDRKQEEKALEDVREEITTELEQTKQNEAFQNHIDQLKDQYNFQILEIVS